MKGSDLIDFNIIFHSHDCDRFCLPVHTCGIKNFDDNYRCSNKCFNIDSVKEFKYLGVTIDFNLNWISHVQTIKSGLLLVARKMFLLRPYCSRKVLSMFYYALANSKLQYGITAWGGSYENTFDSLFKAQKFLIRIICGRNRFAHCWPLFRELRILPLRHLYIFKVLREFFKQSGNTINRNSVCYNLRVNNQALVNVPVAHKTKFCRFFTITGPKCFNKLPIAVRQTSNFHSFLNKVKQWLFNIDYISIESIFRCVS